MNTRQSLIASGLTAGAALLLVGWAAAADVTPPAYGTVSGPAVPSNAPGATDAAGTGTDTSVGVSHAESSGATRNGSTLHGNSSAQPENYGNSSGPAVTRDTPGADDGTGTGPDASKGVTHVQSGGATQQSTGLPPIH